MESLLALSVLSFVLTFLGVKRWISVAKSRGIVARDMNKPGKIMVPECGGIPVIFSISTSFLAYIFLKTFYWRNPEGVTTFIATILTLVLAGFVGFIDDVLGWKKGISQLKKPLLTLPIAIPLAVINAGTSTMMFPLIGQVDLGLLYPLLIVPLGIIGATNAFNLFAGYNGLEAGMGALIFFFLGLKAISIGNSYAQIIAFVSLSSLLAFLYFNWYPARVFPGNSFTYGIGALIACTAIVGNMEKLALYLFLFYFLDFALYLKGRFLDRLGDVQAFARPKEDFTLELPYEKPNDLTHYAIIFLKRIKGSAREEEVVLLILFAQFILGASLVFIGA